jgi:hypothetical protein
LVPSVLETAESEETDFKLSTAGHGPLLPVFEFDSCCISRPVGAAVGVSIFTPGMTDALLSRTASLLLPTDGLLFRAGLFIKANLLEPGAFFV